MEGACRECLGLDASGGSATALPMGSPSSLGLAGRGLWEGVPSFHWQPHVQHMLLQAPRGADLMPGTGHMEVRAWDGVLAGPSVTYGPWEPEQSRG